ncbi:hypothetical protein [Denitromonas halophila]|uniref:Uncharacterized protein n=1 Tax=Denitromonas halophila TaxID=1629404 RepID=A0A557QIE6_9RHOO|nr:hypothetical protein [Denitromonas halophila]TVO52665.1 hypothetical protein FHP91_17165 [Denitromonas halophila]
MLRILVPSAALRRPLRPTLGINMSKPWTERHGGLWLNRARTSDKLVAEEYDEKHEAFTLIWQRASDGHFQVEYLIKGKEHRDPQWSLPFWGNIAGQGIFGTLGDAQAHLKAVAAEPHRRVADAQQ